MKNKDLVCTKAGRNVIKRPGFQEIVKKYAGLLEINYPDKYEEEKRITRKIL